MNHADAKAVLAREIDSIKRTINTETGEIERGEKMIEHHRRSLASKQAMIAALEATVKALG